MLFFSVSRFSNIQTSELICFLSCEKKKKKNYFPVRLRNTNKNHLLLFPELNGILAVFSSLQHKKPRKHTRGKYFIVLLFSVPFMLSEASLPNYHPHGPDERHDTR